VSGTPVSVRPQHAQVFEIADRCTLCGWDAVGTVTPRRIRVRGGRRMTGATSFQETDG